MSSANGASSKRASNPKQHDEVQSSAHKRSRSKFLSPAEKGTLAAAWLLYPMTPEYFMTHYYERMPLLIRRRDSYYTSLPGHVADAAAEGEQRPGGLFSVQQFKQLVQDEKLTFESDLDVTQYKDGERWTLNGSGVATLDRVWRQQLEQQGCSLRMRCPQAHVPAIHALCSQLEDYWGTFVGSNAYLTPPSTQGFAPHFDDIEAFILQLHGQKHWRVYPPRNADETLPKYSSPNFDQDEIGSPCLEVTLCPGDLLYFPKGWVHQADTVGSEASLHVTVSCGQQSTWGDLMQFALDSALRRALAAQPALRRLPPRGYARYMGTLAGHDADDSEAGALSAALSASLSAAQGVSGAGSSAAKAPAERAERFAAGSTVGCLLPNGASCSAEAMQGKVPVAVVDASCRDTAGVTCDEWGMEAPVSVAAATDDQPQLSANPSAPELHNHRASFLHCASTLAQGVFEMLDTAAIDDGADALALKFLKERLPALNSKQAGESAKLESSAAAASGQPATHHEAESNPVTAVSAVRLVNPSATRITLQAATDDGEQVEGGVAVVTCSAQNSKRFLQKPPETVQFPATFAPAVEALIAAHPASVIVGDLPVLVDEEGTMVPAAQASHDMAEEHSDDEADADPVDILADIIEPLESIGAVEVVA